MTTRTDPPAMVFLVGREGGPYTYFTVLEEALRAARHWDARVIVYHRGSYPE